MLVVCRKLGISNVFRVNGPAGIAALGFGTESIPQVRMVVGPGSPAVTLAQIEMQRHGVTTMMLLGPTESVVIADGSADPVRLAADLLIEAEHGTDSTVVLLTPDRGVGSPTVDAELAGQLAELPDSAGRRGPRRARRRTAAVSSPPTSTRPSPSPTASPPSTCRSPSTTSVESATVDAIVNAGEILVGQHTPFSAANFVIGCPASLPTSGFAHVSSGITAMTFLKRTAVAKADATALAADGAVGRWPSPTTRASRPTPPPSAGAVCRSSPAIWEDSFHSLIWGRCESDR